MGKSWGSQVSFSLPWSHEVKSTCTVIVYCNSVIIIHLNHRTAKYITMNFRWPLSGPATFSRGSAMRSSLSATEAPWEKGQRKNFLEFTYSQYIAIYESCMNHWCGRSCSCIFTASSSPLSHRSQWLSCERHLWSLPSAEYRHAGRLQDSAFPLWSLRRFWVWV